MVVAEERQEAAEKGCDVHSRGARRRRRNSGLADCFGLGWLLPGVGVKGPWLGAAL